MNFVTAIARFATIAPYTAIFDSATAFTWLLMGGSRNRFRDQNCVAGNSGAIRMMSLGARSRSAASDALFGTTLCSFGPASGRARPPVDNLCHAAVSGRHLCCGYPAAGLRRSIYSGRGPIWARPREADRQRGAGLLFACPPATMLTACGGFLDHVGRSAPCGCWQKVRRLNRRRRYSFGSGAVAAGVSTGAAPTL